METQQHPELQKHVDNINKVNTEPKKKSVHQKLYQTRKAFRLNALEVRRQQKGIRVNTYDFGETPKG